MLVYVVGVLIAAAIIGPTVVVGIENAQWKKNSELLSTPPEENVGTEVAVISFSRSGNTAVMAQKIAQIYKAKEFRLKASDYEPGFVGWTNSLKDARNQAAEVEPEVIDLSAFKTVFLGSPIWLYSPSPPIWDFLKKNRFDGKHVVLFNSYNSKFEQRFIDEFKRIALERGATSFEHKAINRGRMGQQLSTEDFLKEVEALFVVKTNPQQEIKQ